MRILLKNGKIYDGTGSDKVLYYVNDHLGSTREVKDGSGIVRQRYNYYPYGTVSNAWTSSSTTDSSEKRYRFGGKEVTGAALSPLSFGSDAYLDFGARLYSPRSAVWLSLDPMAEEYYPFTPYAYCAGNPVNLVDPEGKDLFVGIYIYRFGLLYDLVGNVLEEKDMDAFTLCVFNALKAITNTSEGQGMVQNLQDSSFSFYIRQGEKSEFKPTNSGSANAFANLERMLDKQSIIIGSGGTII